MNPIQISVNSSCGGVADLSVTGPASQHANTGTFVSQLLGASHQSILAHLAPVLPLVSGISRVLMSGPMSPWSLPLEPLEKPKDCSPNLTSSCSSLYFGEVAVYTSVSKYFSVSNYGECDTSISLSSPYGFSVSPNSTTIAPNSSTSISVTFNPYSEQDYSGYVSGDHGISVYVTGKGVDPNKNESNPWGFSEG